MGFGEKVRYARKQLGLTQTQLAKVLGVSFATINRYFFLKLMNDAMLTRGKHAVTTTSAGEMRLTANKAITPPSTTSSPSVR